MANTGFSAATSYFGTITGLTAKSSNDGCTSSLAEAANSYGDTAAHDVYGTLLNPTTEYVVKATVDLSAIVLGSITATDGHSIMLTTCTVVTAANQPPTVTLAGVEVESGATAKRTYTLSGSVLARAKAQDVASGLSASDSYTAITTTYAIDPHIATVSGSPVASDASHGRVTVQATLTDPTGSATITAGTGFTLTGAPAKNKPDATYVTVTATATKFLTGSEAA